jgi:hypothetical protein
MQESLALRGHGIRRVNRGTINGAIRRLSSRASSGIAGHCYIEDSSETLWKGSAMSGIADRLGHAVGLSLRVHTSPEHRSISSER